IGLFKKKNKILSEDEFYNQLFVNNPEWNTAHPNKEESLRWKIIEDKFLPHIEKHFKLNNSSKSHLDILDLGCGRGWLSNLLSRYGNVIGIEPVKSVAEYGHLLFPGLDIRNETSDKLLEKGYKGFFDLVVCSEVIEHIPDNNKKQFITNINMLLKPDGFAIISTPRLEALNEWQKYSDPEQPIEDWISEKALKEGFINCNFKDLLLERLSIAPSSNAPDIEVYQLWLFGNSNEHKNA
ncbi:MAG TPA: class I SAM-dependent methyltransferase, partial [Ferruginibacter sp.]|nr:class I SAM-dependent methyltransferase [Ferruginibacter sp.]